MKAEVSSNWRLWNNVIVCLFLCISCFFMMSLYVSVGISKDIALIESQLDAAAHVEHRETPDAATNLENAPADVADDNSNAGIVQFLSGGQGRIRRDARNSRALRKRDRRSELNLKIDMHVGSDSYNYAQLLSFQILVPEMQR